MRTGSNYYRILGVPLDASPEEIRRAYHAAARQYHPDKNKDPHSQTQFLGIQEAYEVLSDSVKRAEYDAELPQFTQDPHVDLNVIYSRSKLYLVDEPQLVYVFVRLTCQAQQKDTEASPRFITLVADRSTSMQDERMDMVKSNIARLIKNLQPRDIISVVAFSDRAEVVIPPTTVMDIPQLQQKVSLIQTSGGTEIFQGLQQGISQLRTKRFRKANRHLFLLTDGHTYGDEGACFDLAEDAARDRIAIHTLGIGNDWNLPFLEKLSALSGGACVYVNSATILEEFLDRKVVDIGEIYARGVTVYLDTGRHVELQYAYRLSPDNGPLPVRGPMCLGDLSYNQSVEFIFEFKVDQLPRDEEVALLAEANLTLEIPASDKLARLVYKFERPYVENPQSEYPPRQVIEAMSLLTMYRMQEKAREEAQSGEIEKAVKRLQYLASHLLSQGKRELAHTVLKEVERLNRDKKYGDGGEKKIKFGTQALFLPSGAEDTLK